MPAGLSNLLLVSTSAAACVALVRAARRVSQTGTTIAPLGLTAAASVLWTLSEASALSAARFPLSGDGARVASYALVALGLWRLLKLHQPPDRDARALLDATVIGLGVFAIEWFSIAGPDALADGPSVVSRITALAYPVGTALTIALVSLVHLRTGLGRLTSARLLFGAVVLLGACDTAAAHLALHASGRASAALVAVRAVAYTAAVLASLHPTSLLLGRPLQTPGAAPTGARAAGLGVAAAIPLVLLVVELFGRQDRLLSVALAVGTGASLSLAFLRVGLAATQNARTAQRVLLEDERLRAHMDAATSVRRRVTDETHAGLLQEMSAVGYELDAAFSNLERGDAAGGAMSLAAARGHITATAAALRRFVTSGSKGRVLFVDDEAYVRSATTLLLSTAGWHVDAVEPQEAVERVQAAPPDVVLVDYLMPGTTGIAVSLELRAAGYGGPIALYSAFLAPDVVQAASALGLAVVSKSEILRLEGIVAELAADPYANVAVREPSSSAAVDRLPAHERPGPHRGDRGGDPRAVGDARGVVSRSRAS